MKWKSYAKAGLLIAFGLLSPAAQGAAAGPHTQVFSPAGYAAMRYVSVRTGSDASDGSRRHPWRTLAHAMHVVSASRPSRVAILVAEGSYAGATVVMKPDIDLLGGFDPSTWTRNIERYPSILDGQHERRVIVGADRARLDGFIIRNGKVRGEGAGLLADGVSPVISNNVFEQNLALRPENWKPDHLHETANDGGGIAVLRGGAPEIVHNLFVRNQTEAGRGGGIACEHASPRIEANVFLANETGINDPARSSDGGALSIFDHASPLVAHNFFAGNRTDASNDGGGIFVALWSQPEIRANTIVGSWGDDDGGGLFVGGQQHHYGTPLDPIPTASEYLVKIEGNRIIGNDNKSHNAGAGRITMQARVELSGNVIAENRGGLKIETSGAMLRENVFADALTITNTSKASRVLPGPVILESDAIDGPIDLKMEASFHHSCGSALPGSEGNVLARPKFINDAVNGQAVRSETAGYTTTLSVSAPLAPHTLAGRPIQVGETWTIVKSNSADAIRVWGAVNGSPTAFHLPPSYRLRPGTACAGN